MLKFVTKFHQIVTFLHEKYFIYIRKQKGVYGSDARKVMVNKMSFDVNVLSTKPVIKAAASMQNDGGAGNLGYMAQGEKEEKKERKYLDESIFMKKDEGDIFSFDKEPELPEDDFSIVKVITQIINTIKSLFKMS